MFALFFLSGFIFDEQTALLRKRKREQRQFLLLHFICRLRVSMLSVPFPLLAAKQSVCSFSTLSMENRKQIPEIMSYFLRFTGERERERERERRNALFD
ncbi:Hypothetical protein, putative [Bodo saltans]|uniref:Uncharacterized protein n=1 Tax=Bodo saltans TaxID=75058 RepID=A0A0S4JQ83_BODSA|nr:Hypothetical protein, putative [Bodo saltans]|eukprot:CUG93678.1 Hypothetical protein, putative [Bodo saltans]